MNKTRISSLTTSTEEDLFSEFHYPGEIVTENEGSVDVYLAALVSRELTGSSLSFARFAYLKPYNKKLNNLVCSGLTSKFQTSSESFDLWTSPEARSIKQKFHPSV